MHKRCFKKILTQAIFRGKLINIYIQQMVMVIAEGYASGCFDFFTGNKGYYWRKSLFVQLSIKLCLF